MTQQAQRKSSQTKMTMSAPAALMLLRISASVLVLVLVLGVQISCAQLEPMEEPTSVYGLPGGDVEICLPPAKENCETHLLYKISGESSYLLLNATVRGSQPFAESGRAALYTSGDWSEFWLQNLSSSDEGLYNIDRCDGKLASSHTFQLTVCPTEIPEDLVELNGGISGKLHLPDFDPSQKDTVEIYKISVRNRNQMNCYTQVFPGDSHNGVKVVLNGSTIQFFNVTPEDEGDYQIVIKIGKSRECLTMQTIGIQTLRHGFSGAMSYEYTPSVPILLQHALPGQRVNLTCLMAPGYRGRVDWRTPGNQVLSFDPYLQITNLRTSAEENMYIDREDYSLIIQYASTTHSGEYECTVERGSRYELRVCAALEPVFVMFLQGDNTSLVCSEQDGFPELHWYYQREPDQELEILQSGSLVLLPEPLRSKVAPQPVYHYPLTLSYYSLIISDLSAEDSGVFRCVHRNMAARDLACASRSFHLVFLSSSGLDWAYWLHASLMACVLLLMVTALVVVRLWRARGTTHTTHTRRVPHTAQHTPHTLRVLSCRAEVMMECEEEEEDEYDEEGRKFTRWPRR